LENYFPQILQPFWPPFGAFPIKFGNLAGFGKRVPSQLSPLKRFNPPPKKGVLSLALGFFYYNFIG